MDPGSLSLPSSDPGGGKLALKPSDIQGPGVRLIGV